MAHYTPALTPDEQLHYAWLAGNPQFVSLVESALADMPPRELAEELHDRGIYDTADLERAIGEHEKLEGDLQDTEAERDGAEEMLRTIALSLRSADKSIGVRKARAIADVIERALDHEGERFSWAEQRKLETELWSILE